MHYDVLDMGLGYSPDDVIATIGDLRPDLVGLGMMTFGYRRTYALLTRIRQRAPGRAHRGRRAPHVDVSAKAMEDCPAIDYGFVMEAERSFVDLCLGAPLRTSRACCTGRPTASSRLPAEVVERLDDLAFPRYGRFELSRYLGAAGEDRHLARLSAPLHLLPGRNGDRQAVQGAVPRAHRGRDRQFWYQRGYREFDIADDNFSMFPGPCRGALPAHPENAGWTISVDCTNGLRADSVDRHLLEQHARRPGSGLSRSASRPATTACCEC